MKESEIKALISLLDDEDEEVYQMVEDKILSFGDEIIPFLESEWESNLDPLVQNRIEELIHTVQFFELKQRLIDWKNAEEQNLLEGAWILCTYLYPELTLEELETQIEQLRYECWLYLKDDMDEVEQVRAINYVLFNKYHLTANTKNFHSPMNSMVNYVMESKKGNPISLSIIYLLIANKLDMPVYGVNLPNLFVVSYKDEDNQFYINPFNKGLIFSRADIENYIEQLRLEPKDIFFEPCENIDIIKRSLRNLMVSYEKLGDMEKVDEIKELADVLAS